MGNGKRSTSAVMEPMNRVTKELVPDHKVRPHAGAETRRTRGASKEDVLGVLERTNVRFLRLQFTDITGAIKNVEVPASQFEKALDGEIMFDGSSIEGFVRIEESDRT